MLQATRYLSFGWLSPVTAALWRKLIDGFEGFAFRSHLRRHQVWFSHSQHGARLPGNSRREPIPAYCTCL